MSDTPPPAAGLPQRFSLVTQTVDWLRAGLKEGRWEQRIPSERVLCQQLQISRPTLRAALRELQADGLIQLSGRNRRTAAPGGVVRDPAATSHTVGVLAASPLHTMSSTAVLVFDTLRDALTRAGYSVEMRVDRACFSAKPGRALEKALAEKPAAVWVSVGSKEPMQRWFMQRHLPLLVIGSCRPGIALTSVDKDYRAVSRHAGDVLWRKGHRRLALVLPKDALSM